MYNSIEYKPKVGTTFWMLFSLMTLIILVMVFFISGPDSKVVIIVAAVMAAVGLFWVKTTKYTLHSDHLLVQICYFKEEIKYSSIKNITNQYKHFSFVHHMSAALSPDRIMITNAHFTWTVSPVDKEGFLRELRCRCPGAKYLDERGNKGR